MDLFINNQFYIFKKYLQKGAFGMTLLYEKENEYYAIKFFYPKNMDNKNFLNEKNILEILKKNVGCLEYLICFIDAFYITENQNIYDNIYNMMSEYTGSINKKAINAIITQYIDGQDLFDYFEINNLSEKDFFNFILFMFKCLKTLESLHIAHRDIKLENIIRKNNGDYVLIDFGLSCTSDNNGVVGTETYVPYWYTALNDKYIDYVYQDVYGFMTCLYILLNGQYPYENKIYLISNSRNKFLDEYVNHLFENKLFYLDSIESYFLELLIKYNYTNIIKIYNENFNSDKKIYCNIL